MNLLVTGGAGFMGSAFIRYVINKNLAESVINYDLLTYAGNLANLNEVDKNDKYQFVQGDIKDSKKVLETVEKYNIDTIVHFAAETHVDRSIDNPAIFLETNVIGTNVLLEIATEKNLRFHHISTDEVFGALNLEDTVKFNEQTPFNPRSPYSASKAGAEHLVKAYFTTYKTKVTITNSSNNYGPYQYPEKFLPLMITNLLNNKKIPVYGDGLYMRDWLYVDDHAQGVWEVLTKGKIGESYCLAGENEISNIDLIKKVLKLMQKDESYIEYIEDRKGHDRRYAVDISKIKTELGWMPETDFDEGLKKTTEYYKS